MALVRPARPPVATFHQRISANAIRALQDKARWREVCALHVRRVTSPRKVVSAFLARQATSPTVVKRRVSSVPKEPSQQMANRAACAALGSTRQARVPISVCLARPVAHLTLCAPSVLAVRLDSLPWRAALVPSATLAPLLDLVVYVNHARRVTATRPLLESAAPVPADGVASTVAFASSAQSARTRTLADRAVTVQPDTPQASERFANLVLPDSLLFRAVVASHVQPEHSLLQAAFVSTALPDLVPHRDRTLANRVALANTCQLEAFARTIVPRVARGVLRSSNV